MRVIGAAKNSFKYIIIAILVIACTYIQTQMIYAGTSVLEINYAVNDNATPIEGAEFSAVQIASFDDRGIYVLNDLFKNSGYNPNALDKDKLEDTAVKLYDMASNSDAATAITDSNGKCSLALDKGLYLVWQSGSTLTATNYYLANSALIYVTDTENIIYPKTSKKSSSGEGDSGGGSSGGGGHSSTNNSGGPGEASVPPIVIDGTDTSIGNLILGLLPKTGNVREMMPVFSVAVLFIFAIVMFAGSKKRKRDGEDAE